MNRTVQGLVWCSLLFIVAQTFGQEITVAVLNARNGRGLRDAVVWVQFYEAPANRVLQRLQFKTGPDGVAHISLTAQPSQLFVSASASSFCLGGITSATVDILKHGVVHRCDPKGCDTTPTPTPGQVTFLVRRIPWWIRLIAPLERG